jgi:hypothetical protein
MKVKELIAFLQLQDQDQEVAYTCMSEQCTLEENEIEIVDLCEEREDGWIQDRRPDMKTKKYLLFPGN